LDAILGDLEQVLAVEGRSGVGGATCGWATQAFMGRWPTLPHENGLSCPRRALGSVGGATGTASPHIN
jgi:hypothetical protein